jgi:hypothetical protein
MEPNKLEQDIQQKLQGRTIQPSANAWDRLDAMLTVAEQQAAPQEEKVVPVKKNNRSWLYMAAAFLLMLGGGFFLMNQEAEQNLINTVSTPQVVGVPTDNNETATEVAETVKETPETIVTKGAGIKRAMLAKNQLPKATLTKQVVPNQEIAQNIQATDNTPKAETPEVQKRKLRVDPEALLASVEGTQPKPGLASINQPKVKVNANNLLDNVEGELNQSFRNKVLNSLEKNYNVVKTAVATRNLE